MNGSTRGQGDAGTRGNGDTGSQPPPVPASPHPRVDPLPCPYCKMPLNKDTLSGAEVTGCHYCGGIWFEGDALTRLVREHSAILDDIDLHFTAQWSSKAEKRDPPVCALCGEQMLAKEFRSAPGLPLHACAGCETLWLSKGQLSKLHRIVGPIAPSQPAPPPHAAAPPLEEASEEQKDLKERLFNLPVWALCAWVAGFGLLTGLVAIIGGKAESTQGSVQTIMGLDPLGKMLFFAAVTVVRWLFQSFVLWIGLWFMGLISGDRFQVGFVEGFKTFLPVSLVMQFVANTGLVLLLITQNPVFLFAGIANILVLRYFLEIDGFELLLLGGVLWFMSCATGGLL